MSRRKLLIDRIEEDFQHGGKLGPKSTANVILLLREMHDRLTHLENVETARHAGLPGYA